MNWICVATNIKNDVSVALIADACKVRIAEAVGLVTNVYCDLPKNARDGDISAVPDVLIEQWARWEGKRGVFAKAFRANLCNSEGIVRSWEKYNGAAIRESDANIERVREWRKNRQKKPDSTGDVTPTVRRTKRVTNTVANAVTNADRTAVDVDVDKDLTTATANAAAAVSRERAEPPAAAAAELPEQFAQRAAELRANFTDPRAALAFDRHMRASRNPEGFLLDVEYAAKLRPSDHAAGVPWDVIGQALHELSAKGRTATEHLIRVFAGPILTPSTPTTAMSEADAEAAMLRRIEAGEFARG